MQDSTQMTDMSTEFAGGGGVSIVRDKSLLMPGRGPEEIFMNSKNVS